MVEFGSVATGISIAKGVTSLTTKLHELYRYLKDRDLKQMVDEILDQFRELKQQASELEDENRALREKLRFKSDDYAFDGAFFYHKDHPKRPLCPSCHADFIDAAMSEASEGKYRTCFRCGKTANVPGPRPTSFTQGPFDSPYSEEG